MSVLPIFTRRLRSNFPRSAGRVTRLAKPLSWSPATYMLILAALTVAGLLLLTPVYLVVRTVGSGTAALDTPPFCITGMLPCRSVHTPISCP